jgi:hypothetical protein
VNSAATIKTSTATRLAYFCPVAISEFSDRSHVPAGAALVSGFVILLLLYCEPRAGLATDK